jgi:hypothetical protein
MIEISGQYDRNDARCTHVKLNAGLQWQKQHSVRRLLPSANGIKFMEETSTVLHLEHSFVLY